MPIACSRVPTLKDLDAYLARIGHDGPVTLAGLHRSHATSIPFENFESSAGRAVSLEPSHLEEKLVARRRGGYCFEQNLLFMAALQTLDYEVHPLLARVRNGARESPMALNHLLLRVVERGEAWLADVGFGGGGLLGPMPFRAGAEGDQAGWRYQVVEDAAELVLQVHQDGDWSDMYGFVPEPALMVDIEVANWYTSTHPTSPFVTGVIAGIRLDDRCLTFVQFDEPSIVERQVGKSATTSPVSRSDVPELFERRFGIPGVEMNAEGRPVLGSASA